MKRIVHGNPRQSEYLEYLDNHISGVKDSWMMLKQNLLDAGYDLSEYPNIDSIINIHDSSKWDWREFDPYCNHFYPSEGFEDNEQDFDDAWLCHQHANPHHWQHWVLIRDSGELEPQDMPFEYICEMLCDWHSFSRKDPTSTAYNWYQSNKDTMMLSNNTRASVDDLIEFLKEPIR